MDIVCLQHVPFEGPGYIEDYCREQGHTLDVHPVFERGTEGVRPCDLLIALGGPMSVNDGEQYPWLGPELKLLQARVTRGEPTLGICLGAQLIAAALGAAVHKQRAREIGWFPVRVTQPRFDWPERFVPFHWHGETFELPRGAEHLVESEACKNQAFGYGSRVLGLQFHLEVMQPNIRALLENCADDLEDQPYCQTPGQMLERSAGHVEQCQGLMRKLLHTLCA